MYSMFSVLLQYITCWHWFKTSSLSWVSLWH